MKPLWAMSVYTMILQKLVIMLCWNVICKQQLRGYQFCNQPKVCVHSRFELQVGHDYWGSQKFFLENSVLWKLEHILFKLFSQFCIIKRIFFFRRIHQISNLEKTFKIRNFSFSKASIMIFIKRYEKKSRSIFDQLSKMYFIWMRTKGKGFSLWSFHQTNVPNHYPQLFHMLIKVSKSQKKKIWCPRSFQKLTLG